MLDNNLTQSRWKGQREVEALFYMLYSISSFIPVCHDRLSGNKAREGEFRIT
uniref:Uncharacterized protein n=1 Tax=Siphoviridae sp. ctbrg2 TaxID=2823589 RepID=A0A8S5LG63_9CAUD|nr:MAG TPA: hypothetical protein [Siphoviridae sp. ctbrg2]